MQRNRRPATQPRSSRLAHRCSLRFKPNGATTVCACHPGATLRFSRTAPPPPPAGSADEPTRLKDGSTACCNRTQCPGPSKCWWLHPDLCYNADTFFSRYRNELKYGKERAAFTAAVEDAWRAGRPVPTLAEFRRQHPHLVGTSSHREPFNPAHAYHSSTIEVSEDAYSVPPLTEDLH